VSDTIAAVVLAAGGSTRFGSSKQQLAVGEETLLQRAVSAAVQAGCIPVAVVVGAELDALASDLSATPATIVYNPEWREGIGASIRVGVQHLVQSSEATEAVILLACDQPQVNARTLTELIRIREATRKPIVTCAYAGTFGIPTLFDRTCFDELLALKGDQGAKALILSRRNDVETLDFPGGAIDIDTPADYERLAANT